VIKNISPGEQSSGLFCFAEVNPAPEITHHKFIIAWEKIHINHKILSVLVLELISANFIKSAIFCEKANIKIVCVLQTNIFGSVNTILISLDRQCLQFLRKYKVSALSHYFVNQVGEQEIDGL
jgi:hypothetical protein